MSTTYYEGSLDGKAVVRIDDNTIQLDVMGYRETYTRLPKQNAKQNKYLFEGAWYKFADITFAPDYDAWEGKRMPKPANTNDSQSGVGVGVQANAPSVGIMGWVKRKLGLSK